MRKAGARWDRPEAFRDFVDSATTIDMYTTVIGDVLRSPAALAYLGPRRYLATRGRIGALSIPWGWKDPRNTFTLPFWLRLFPEAKVVEVRRHGVDVAASLSARHRALVTRDVNWLRRSQSAFFLGSAVGPLGRASRVASIEGAFAVWLEYVREAERQRRSHEAGRWLQVRYEDLLDDPVGFGQRLAAFAGCDASEENCSQFAASVDASRRYAFRHDRSLQNVAVDHAKALERFGYPA